MCKYVNRLIKCGYSPDDAYATCVSFIKNLSLFDLEMFISTMEKVKEARNVDRV